MHRRARSIPYLLAGKFRKLAFEEWGDPDAPPVLCVHGLTRNGRDFDVLAQALSTSFRVICPDLPGRGNSEWLDDPMLYQAQHYVTVLGHLLAWIGRDVAWVGTSLGGICGMVVAATDGAPINRLVLNDVGPFIPADALRRIRDYMVASGDSPMMSRFPDLDAIDRHLRIVHAPFGPLSDEQWAELARNSARALPDGRFAMHYDPRIAEPLRGHDPVDVDMWAFWTRIQVPRLVIRGETSDILLPDTFARMEASGADAYQVPVTGHAPALLDPLQIETIRAFLSHLPMRPLPEQAVHLPFDPGPHRMAMDLVSVPEPAWFAFDQQYLPDMTEKRRLLATAYADVFAATPVSDAARQETLDLIAAALTTHHPDWFSCDASLLRNHLTGEQWRVGSIDPLDLAGRLVQEDLCLIQNGADGPVFTAASLCFPSRWRLADKIGKPLSSVHAPVPLYADRLAAPVDRFMRHLKPGRIASRLNWSLLDDPALFQPGGKWRVDGGSGITPENAGSHVFLRVERQTLRRLPQTDAVLFGIRVHVYPLDQVIDTPSHAARLASAIAELPVEIQRYKSLPPFRDALLKWLGAKQAGVV